MAVSVGLMTECAVANNASDPNSTQSALSLPSSLCRLLQASQALRVLSGTPTHSQPHGLPPAFPHTFLCTLLPRFRVGVGLDEVPIPLRPEPTPHLHLPASFPGRRG